MSGTFTYWKLDAENFTLHDGRGYEIDLEKLISWHEWNDWIRHVRNKVTNGVPWPSPEPEFWELFPNGPLKSANAVRRHVTNYVAVRDPRALIGNTESVAFKISAIRKSGDASDLIVAPLKSQTCEVTVNGRTFGIWIVELDEAARSDEPAEVRPTEGVPF